MAAADDRKFAALKYIMGVLQPVRNAIFNMQKCRTIPIWQRALIQNEWAEVVKELEAIDPLLKSEDEAIWPLPSRATEQLQINDESLVEVADRIVVHLETIRLRAIPPQDMPLNLLEREYVKKLNDECKNAIGKFIVQTSPPAPGVNQR